MIASHSAVKTSGATRSASSSRLAGAGVSMLSGSGG
jgi:hypothetical protein